MIGSPHPPITVDVSLDLPECQRESGGNWAVPYVPQALGRSNKASVFAVPEASCDFNHSWFFSREERWLGITEMEGCSG